MEMTDFVSDDLNEVITICPSCGGTDHNDNRLCEHLYTLAAKEAPRLRHEGRVEEAIDVLSALYSIRIINFMRPRWRCACGVTFDA